MKKMQRSIVKDICLEFREPVLIKAVDAKSHRSLMLQSERSVILVNNVITTRCRIEPR